LLEKQTQVYITNICLFDYINILTMKRTTEGQKIMFSLEGFTAPVALTSRDL